MENTLIRTALSMKEDGGKTSKTAKARKPLKTAQSSLVNLKQTRKMDSESTLGLTALSNMENGSRTICLASVSTSGQTENPTKDNGSQVSNGATVI